MAGLLQTGFSLAPRVSWPTVPHQKSSLAKRTLSRNISVALVRARSAESRSTKLVTFLGKGGSGKTITALLAAHHYARSGLRTCLVLQSQEPTADFLLGKRIGGSLVSLLDGALDVIRLETTKLLLEPLAQIKKADRRLNFSQGALEEVVGEELSVLPGMDSILALGAMEGFIGFAADIIGRRKDNQVYDIVVYDGVSTEETLRLVGTAEKSRWYLQRARSLSERTDTGRVTSPSMLRLIEASFTQEASSEPSGRTIADLWDGADRVLDKIAQTFADSKRFACYLVMDRSNQLSVSAALRYWGCAMQAGAHVAGAFTRVSAEGSHASKNEFTPLAVADLPALPLNAIVDWDEAIARLSSDAKALFSKDSSENIPVPVEYNLNAKTVSFFLPGFQKSEIKLSRWRGGSALLIEVGDQRRVVDLPSQLRGKVGGAKFEDKRLVVSMKTG